MTGLAPADGKDGASAVPHVTRVLLVEDHPVVRSGLRALLATETDIAVVGETASIAGAVALGRAHLPDVAVLDLGLEDTGGVAGVSHFVQQCPDVRVLVLSSQDHLTVVRACLRAGAGGFLSKSSPLDKLADVLRTVVTGQTFLDPRLVPHLLKPGVELTARELDALQAAASGGTNRQIAALLGVSEHTVKTHLSKAMSKLQAADRAHAVAEGLRLGILR